MPIPQLEKKQESQVIPFAETNYRGVRRRFGIKIDDRRRHMYLLGKTGMGKSTIMENMIIADMRAGNGVGVIDPHGDLVEKILDFIPSNRVNDIIYFNPSDSDWPIAFNVLETVDEKHKHLVASGLMGVFKKIWPDVWSARMEYIMNNTILALLDYPGSTMLGIQRMLADKEFRKKVIDKVTDPVVKMFWVDEFSKYNERFASEAIAPIQNKVGQFLSSVMIRNIVAQVKSTINMRDIMDNKKVFLVNLSKGRIGEDNARLLGGMLITKLQISAMERVDLAPDDRKDFFLYVDEFQNFANESFANILSEARKYRLDLIMAHQYLEQLDEEVMAAVFGNVGTVICFRVGAKDAEFLEPEFAPQFEQTDLVNLSKFNMYIRLMIDGVASEPFSATGLPPLMEDEKTGNLEKIIRSSRERYTKPRAVVEDKIARWTGMMNIEDAEEAKPASPIHRPNIFNANQESLKPRPVVLPPASELPKPKINPPAKISIEPKNMLMPETISLSDAFKAQPVGFKAGRTETKFNRPKEIPRPNMETRIPEKPMAGRFEPAMRPRQMTTPLPSARPISPASSMPLAKLIPSVRPISQPARPFPVNPIAMPQPARPFLVNPVAKPISNTTNQQPSTNTTNPNKNLSPKPPRFFNQTSKPVEKKLSPHTTVRLNDKKS